MGSSKRKKQFPLGKGGNPELSAWRGGANDFAAYGSGYFDAANFLAEKIISKGALGELAVDVAIYPILYLYRQATELMLKHFIYDKPNASPLRGSHNLEHLWKQARLEVETMLDQNGGGPAEKKALKRLDKFIARMHVADPSGEAFRFPEDLQRAKYLEEFKEMNLQPIYESSKEAGEILIWFADARTEIRADEYEAMQELECN